LTIQQYFRVNGASVQLKGVVPDVLLADPMSFVESGERTLPHAIPWSTIAAVPFAKTPHAWKVSDLAAASATRTNTNAELATVTKLAKMMEARKDKTLRSVERTAWQAEYKRTKAEAEALDPKKRDQKPLLEVAPLPTEGAAQDPRMQRQLDKWKDSLSRDPWVDESARVLADMKKAK
jgi:carboxyl-terminal processing protease